MVIWYCFAYIFSSTGSLHNAFDEATYACHAKYCSEEHEYEAKDVTLVHDIAISLVLILKEVSGADTTRVHDAHDHADPEWDHHAASTERSAHVAQFFGAGIVNTTHHMDEARHEDEAVGVEHDGE